MALITPNAERIIMKRSVTKQSSPLKIALLIIGFVISGLILIEGLDKDAIFADKSGKHDSLKENIESKKNLIVNTYLIGVSIYQEAVD